MPQANPGGKQVSPVAGTDRSGRGGADDPQEGVCRQAEHHEDAGRKDGVIEPKVPCGSHHIASLEDEIVDEACTADRGLDESLPIKTIA